MIKFNIEITGDEAINRALDGLLVNMRDFRPIWPKVSSTFSEIERRLFDSAGATGASGAWKPLSAAYGQWKQVNYPGEPILHLTGNLRRSLTDVFNPDAIVEMNPDSLIRGTNVRSAGGYPYATAHQRGKGLSRRPPIDMTASDKQELLDSFRDGFGDVARALHFEVV